MYVYVYRNILQKLPVCAVHTVGGKTSSPGDLNARLGLLESESGGGGVTTLSHYAFKHTEQTSNLPFLTLKKSATL